jgi:regulator of sigma E protease
MTVIILLILLAVLILVHELGHFLAAKASGMRVDEFGVGFPPRLVGLKRGETTYSLNLIPLGGFVKIFGENGEEKIGDDQRQFTAKSRWVQAGVLVAGVTANLLLAWLLLAATLSVGLPTARSTAPQAAGPSKLVILNILPDSPAAQAGLAPGDELIRLEAGAEILTAPANDSLAVETVQTFIANHPRESIELTYRRGNLFGKELAPQTTVKVEPIDGLVPNLPGRAAIGVAMEEIVLWQTGPLRALGEGLQLTGKLTVATVGALFHIIGQALQGENALASLTGPVGLAGVVGDAWRLGLVYLLSLAALISINLAVINLFPIPALDGGRLLLLGVEALKGRPLKPAVANWLNTVGAALLILLMLVITYRDIANLVN